MHQLTYAIEQRNKKNILSGSVLRQLVACYRIKTSHYLTDGIWNFKQKFTGFQHVCYFRRNKQLEQKHRDKNQTPDEPSVQLRTTIQITASSRLLFPQVQVDAVADSCEHSQQQQPNHLPPAASGLDWRSVVLEAGLLYAVIDCFACEMDRWLGTAGGERTFSQGEGIACSSYHNVILTLYLGPGFCHHLGLLRLCVST